MDEQQESGKPEIPVAKKIFKKKLKEQPKRNPEDHPKFKELSVVLGAAPRREDEDIEDMDTAPEQIPIDPFNQREIINPVKNKRCGHVYDRESIQEMINSIQTGRVVR